MEVLRQRTLYILIAAITILSVLFFAGGPDYHSPRYYKTTWNLGHIIYFAILPLLILHRPKLKCARQITQVFIVLATTLIIGLLVELSQYNFQRTPDIGDILRDLIGALIAIFFLLPIRKSIPKLCLIWTKLTIIAMVVIQFYPIVIALYDEHQARQQFPILADFQTPFQIHRWTGDADRHIDNATLPAENMSMRVNLTTQHYSGVSLKYFIGNWEQYKQFQFRIYNPSTESISLTCRIHDALHTQGAQEYHDRFNKTYSAEQGWNTFTINLEDIKLAPETRQMDLRQIQGIGIFATCLPHPGVIYIDDLKLLHSLPAN